MKRYKIIYIFLLVILLFITSKTASAYGFGFKKNTTNTQPDIGIYKQIIESNGGLYVGDKDSKNIYLTFDCGYENGYTAKILDVLKEKNLVATFFLTGHYIDSASELVLRMKSEGHVLANHSDKHKDITKITNSEIEKEIKDLETKYYNLTGSEITKFFRPPAGTFDSRSLAVVNGMGYKTLFWSLAYQDWNHSADSLVAVREVNNNIHNGAIILLHAVSEANSAALGTIIDELRSKGYVFSSTTNLL